jgi:hypothetical protein
MSTNTETPLGVYLHSRAVMARYGVSRRKLYELTRLGRIPHRVMPYGKHVLFEAAWLERWENGCELETIELPGNGRVVRPK